MARLFECHFRADGGHVRHACLRHNAVCEGLGAVQLVHHAGVDLARPVSCKQTQAQDDGEDYHSRRS